MGSDTKDSFAALFEATPGAGRNRARRLHRGDRLEVRVVEIARDTVFVDVGEKQEGFIARTELLGPDGQLAVQIGQTVSAVVAESDGERLRLSPVFVRSTEQSSIDAGGEIVTIPRAKSAPLLVEGAHVRGTVTGVERYGVFVQIAGTQGRQGRGLVPVSETGTPRGADLRKAFQPGSEVEAKILAIAEDGKIRLSFKALGADLERREFEAYRNASNEPAPAAGTPGGADEKGQVSKPMPADAKTQKAQQRSVRSFGTLGDLLSAATTTQQRPRKG
ncbi:MAG: S1 RNA-binding domain-containing protein [Polyangiaceae bacterium]